MSEEVTGAGTDIVGRPIHLGRHGSAEIEPTYTAEFAWYEAYGERHADDGTEGRLVALHTFDKSWTTWEMHPHGSEIVLCTAGKLVLHQERPEGSKATIELVPGQYAINEPGTWHTADIDGTATALFITAGWGTQIRKR